MYIDPFYLLKSVLNAHAENRYTTDEARVQWREYYIYTFLKTVCVCWGEGDVNCESWRRYKSASQRSKDPYEFK